MKLKSLSGSLPLILLVLTNPVHAGAMGDVNKPISPWFFEFGPRYWLSTGAYTKNLYDTHDNLISRLSYKDLTANSAEAFWQLTHESGLFVKGYFGGGSVLSGSMNDEDFPPGITPYSNTYQEQRDGSLNYLSMDLGYRIFSNAQWQVSGFVGYHYWSERVNTFGCTQIAGNTVCANIPPTFGPVPTDLDNINNVANWDSLRIGANSTVKFNQSLRLTADIAYVRSHLSAMDYHNLRQDIRGLIEDGTGNGVQLDAILDWMLTQDFSLGFGGRWWHIATDGFSRFEQTSVIGEPQPVQITQNTYGLLVQANYKFDSSISSAKSTNSENVRPWSDLYIGANLGYGTNPLITYITPTSTDAAFRQSSGGSPLNINLQDAGFIVGGQIGYNWQVKQFVLGVEGDIDYTHINGANGLSMAASSVATTVEQSTGWLSTVRARLGRLASDDVLVYLTAGPAFGGTKLNFVQLQPGLTCPSSAVCSAGSNSETKVGWTAGAGAEYAVTNRTTFKAEYLYVDLGSVAVNTVDSSSFDSTYFVKSQFNNNIVRLGVNYRM